MFDEHRGFKLSLVDTWLVDGDYMCVAKRMNTIESDKSKIQYTRFKIAVSGQNDYNLLLIALFVQVGCLMTGVEIATLNQAVVEGDRFNLTCRGRNVRGNASLEWRWTPHQLNEEQAIERKLSVQLDAALIQGMSRTDFESIFNSLRSIWWQV